jgi:hypothetical protein
MPVPTQPTTDIEFVICDLTCGYGYTSTRRVTKKQSKYADLIRAMRQRGWAARAAAPGSCLSDGAEVRTTRTQTPQGGNDNDDDDATPTTMATARPPVRPSTRTSSMPALVSLARCTIPLPTPFARSASTTML